MAEYVAPELDKSAFNCPYCGAYAKMDWYDVYYNAGYGYIVMKSPLIKVAFCSCCNRKLIWNDQELLIPSFLTAPMPHKDMPECIKNDYLEAREILNKSPRGACAILRLALQKLCDEFVKGKKNVNEQIAELVKQGLPVQLQKAFDIVRVVGNNAVHPGVISIEDNPDIALMLFKLVNMIVEKMITEPKEIHEFYDNTIPEKAKNAIEKRDSTALGA